jgi:hypothetical protein
MVEESKTKKRPKKIRDERPTTIAGVLWKIVLLGIADAIVLLMVMVMLGQERIIESVVTTIVAVIFNWIYLRKGGLPAKYLAPGVLFLLIFQVYVLLFSGYTAFTNYGSAHNGDQALAINTIKNTSFRVVEGDYFVTTLVKDQETGERALLLTSGLDQAVYIGKDGQEKVALNEGEYTLSKECADKYDEDVVNCAKAAISAVGYTTVPVDGLNQFEKNKYLSLRVVLDPENPNLGI